MISVAGRLLESWLDSQTERRYQPAFIQLLVAHGWTVLHNTRHSPIELGKDVIARCPQGVLHCFQLKGNPGSRVTKTEAAGLLTQVIELIQLPAPLHFRRSLRERHVAVFLTNGEIDEEAQLLFERAAERIADPTTPAERFEIWSRGKLLSLFSSVAEKIWPASIEGTRLILNLLAGSGRAQPKPTEIAAIVQSMMPPADASAPARTGALASMLMMAEVIKSRWYERQNQHALFVVTVLTCVAVLPLADKKPRRNMLRTYASLALDHARLLLEEAVAREFEPDKAWYEGQPLAEIDILWERRRLVGDCAATLLLSGTELSPDIKRYSVEITKSIGRSSQIWGQAQIPSFLLNVWARHRTEAGLRPELELAGLLREIILRNGGKNSAEELPQPYYGFEDVWALRENLPHATNSSIFQDSSRGRIFFARAIMAMLAKRNLKATCRSIWPAYSKLIHEETELNPADFYSATLAQAGLLHSIQFKMGFWDELVNSAIDGEADFLEGLDEFAWLIAAYVAIVPYRAWTPVILWLDGRFCPTWYHRGYRPGASKRLES